MVWVGRRERSRRRRVLSGWVCRRGFVGRSVVLVGIGFGVFFGFSFLFFVMLGVLCFVAVLDIIIYL